MILLGSQVDPSVSSVICSRVARASRASNSVGVGPTQVPICRAVASFRQSNFGVQERVCRLMLFIHRSRFSSRLVTRRSQHQLSSRLCRVLCMDLSGRAAGALFLLLSLRCTRPRPSVRPSLLSLPPPFRERFRKRNRELKVIHLPRCC